MRIGDGGRFCVEYEIAETVETWVFGKLCFIVDGSIVGDPGDRSVDLKGCLRWLEEFLAQPKARYEPGLFDMPKEQAFLRLGASVLTSEDGGDFAKEIYEDTYGRFHISHLGMSSFDSVVLLLAQDEKGRSRLIWKDGAGGLHEAVLPAGEVERVLQSAADALRKSIAAVA
ncbi:Imm42 family immunity protein [Aquimonas voraii]|uniref:Imm42 family immunity protein n=1 Tax=Aquimonas voraii TaxID=265719 RepID=UPI000B88BB5E|nr:Imm42 family immunity protein [Aquimonas voraii]